MQSKKKITNQHIIITCSQLTFGESWAKNKIGEFYRTGTYVNKNLSLAFEYYTDSSNCAKFTLCPWACYNLAKYFYKYGVMEIGIQKNINKAIELLTYVESDLIEACYELLFIYYELYVSTNKKTYLDKVLYYKEKCENHNNFNSQIKKDIEKKLLLIKQNPEKLELP